MLSGARSHLRPPGHNADVSIPTLRLATPGDAALGGLLHEFDEEEL